MTTVQREKRIAYVDRWSAFPPEERERIAGDAEQAHELDLLAERLESEDTTDEEHAEIVAQLYTRLDSLTARIVTTESHLERLRRQRRRTFAELLIAGEQQARVGTRSSVSASFVSVETGIATKKR